MKKILICIIMCLCVVGFSFEVATVIRAVDGDTLKVLLNGATETVRLIGVDTPESVHPTKPVEEGSLEASVYTKQLVGKTVLLTYDKNKRDFYQRILAYVWIDTEEGLDCWNTRLIKEGYGVLYDKYKFSKIHWFKKDVEPYWHINVKLEVE